MKTAIVVFALLVALLAAPSLQLGKLLTDRVTANQEGVPVSFPAIDADVFTVEEADIRNIDVRDSDGVNLQPKSAIIRTDSGVTLSGFLSAELGTIGETRVLNVESSSDVIFASEKSLFMSQGSVRFTNSGTGPTLIGSGHDTRFHSNTTDIKSTFGVLFAGSSVSHIAEREYRIDADAFYMNSVTTSSIRASSGNIQMTASNSVIMQANAVDVDAAVSSQLVGQNNIDITAASVINGEGGSGLISSLLGTTVTSQRRGIEFGARTTLDVNAGANIALFGLNGFIIEAQGDSGSHIDFNSGGDFTATFTDGISLTGSSLNINSAPGEVVVDVEQVVFKISHLFQVSAETLANSVDIEAADEVKLFSTSDLIFTLQADVFIDSVGDIIAQAPAVTYIAQKNAIINSAGSATTITGGHVLIESQDEFGGVTIAPAKNLVMRAGRDTHISARDVDFTATNQPFNFVSGAGVLATAGSGASINVKGTQSIKSVGGTAVNWQGETVSLTSTTTADYQSAGSIAITSRGVTDVSGSTSVAFQTNTAGQGNIVTTSQQRDIVITTGADLDHTSKDFLINTTDAMSFHGGDFTAQAAKFSVTAKGTFELVSEKNTVKSTANTGQSITAAGKEILLSAHDDLAISGKTGVLFTGGAQRYEGTSSAGVGIRFTATDFDVDIRSLQNKAISYSSDADLFGFGKTLVQLTGTERHIMTGRESVLFKSTERMFFNSTSGDSSWASSNVFTSTANVHDTTISSQRHIRLRAQRDLSMVADGTTHSTVTSTGDITVSGGGVGLEARETTLTATVPQNLVVRSDTGTTYFTNQDTTIAPTNAYNAKGSETIRLTTDFLGDIHFTAATLFDISASNRIETSTPLLFFKAKNILELIGENGVQMLGRDDGGLIKDDLISTISSGGIISIVATHATNIMSESDAQVLATEGLRGFSDHVSALGSDSTHIKGEGIHATAIGIEKNITMLAGGATDIQSRTGEIFLASARHMNHTQEEYLHMKAIDGTFIIKTPDTNSGANIIFDTTHGTFDIEGHKKIGIEATDVDGKDNGIANMVFDMSGAIDIESNEGGVVLRSEGLLQEAILSTLPDVIRLPSIVLETTDGVGNVVLTSERDVTEISGKLGVTFVTNGTAITRGELGIDITAGRDIRLYTNDTYDANGARGLSIIAGSEVSPNDITFEVEKRVTLGAHDGINLISDGPVFGDGIAIDSFQGSIRFSTSNGKDINVDANQNMEFLVSQNFHAHSNGDVDILSVAGANHFKAQKNLHFEVAGGPAKFEAASGSGGAVTQHARTGSISYRSGGDGFFTAQRDIATQAGTGYSLTVDDGNAHFGAESGLSTIEALAGGSIHVTSSDADAGIQFESANNVEITATGTVSINSVKTVTIGDVSRPVVRINALGDASTPGYVINSDGDMIMETELIVDIDAIEDFDMDATLEIAITSTGQSHLKSTDGNIKFAATRGTAAFHAEEIDFEGEESFDARTDDLFRIESRGRAPEHRIEVVGHRVNMDGRDYKMQAVAIDADATDAIHIRAVNEGIFATDVGKRGSISLAAADSLEASVTNGPFDIITQKAHAPLTIEAVATKSNIQIVAEQQDSPITFRAGSILYVKGDHTTLRALEPTVTAITIEALHDVNNDDGKKADVEVRASKDIFINTETNADIIGEHGVSIRTNFIDGIGNGSPILFQSSRHIELEARQNLTVRTTREDGGSIHAFAADDISIMTKTGDLFILPDHDYELSSLEDQTWTVARNTIGELEGRLDIQSQGRLRGFNEETMLLQTTLAGAKLLFESPLGSIDVRSGQDLTFSAGFVTGGDVNANLVITSDVGSTIKTLAGSVTVTSASSVFQSDDDEVIIRSIQDTHMTAGGKINVIANGVEENSHYGARLGGNDIRIQAASKSIAISSHGGTHFIAKDIAFTAAGANPTTGIAVTSNGPTADIVIDSEGTTHMTSIRKFTSGATRDATSITGTGAVSLRSGKLMSFDSKSARINLATAKSATNAFVRVQANGELFMNADAAVSIKSIGNEGSNVYLQSNNGIMHFKTTGNAVNTHAVGIDVRARTGDILISARARRAAIVQATTDIFLRASGDINMVATAETGAPPGFQIDTLNLAVQNLDHDVRLGGGYMDLNAVKNLGIVSVDPTAAVSGPGHDFVFNIVNDATFSANTDLTISTYNYGQIALEGNSPVGEGDSSTAGVFFDPIGATPQTIMNDQARFLIPFTDEVINQGQVCPFPREFVYTTGEQYSPNVVSGKSRLCVCDHYTGLNGGATGVWRCSDGFDLGA